MQYRKQVYIDEMTTCNRLDKTPIGVMTVDKIVTHELTADTKSEAKFMY